MNSFFSLFSLEAGLDTNSNDLAVMAPVTTPAAASVEHTWFGTDGDDTFVATNSEAHAIYALAGNDEIFAGHGNDRIFADDGNDRVFAGGGDDYIVGGDGDDALTGQDGHDHFVDGPGDDRMIGEDGSDYFLAGEGENVYDGGASSDRVDFVQLEFGISIELNRDAQHLASGTTFLIDIEHVSGTNFDDVIDGDNGANVIAGGNGDDVLYGDDGNDALLGNDGNDELYGEDEVDQLSGGAGDDLLDAGSEGGVMRGDDGADRLLAGNGADRMNGGAGDDVFVFTEAARVFMGPTDTIEDFEGAGAPGGDLIDLSQFGDADVRFSGVQPFSMHNITTEAQGSDTLLTVRTITGVYPELSVVLEGVAPSIEFTADDFIF